MFRTFKLNLCSAMVFVAVLSAGVTFAQQESKPQFTVIYLKTADAVSVAQTLDTLLGENSSRINTRIVPEPRTNALFVSTNPETLKQIEQFLKILDQQPENSVKDIQVFALKHLSAQDAEQVVVGFVGPSVKLSFDARTNSLIAEGSEKDLAALEALLLRLDQPTDQIKRPKVVTIDLEHISALEARDILRELHTSATANIAVDEAHNRLLVSAPGMTLEEINQIVDLVDARDRGKLEAPVQVRLVWLMELVAGEEPKPPSSDTELERVARSVEKRLGLAHLNSVAQLLVTVEPESSGEGRSFTARGTAELKDETLVDLEFEGFIIGGSAQRPVLEFSVNANQRSELSDNSEEPREVIRSERELAALNSTVAIPAGHSVVLGVTSIRSKSSVFIVQILPASPDLQTTEE